MSSALQTFRRSPSTSLQLGGASVLLVEDDVDTRLALELRLGAHGCDVATAGCVQEALVELSSCHPRVVILDLGLPDGCGIEVLQQVSTIGVESGSHVIVLSACEDPELVREALCCGASLYMCKPVDGAELVSAIEFLLAAS